MEFCKDENCLNRSESPVDILVKNWGYEDLLPENIPIFDEVPYHVHMFVGILLTVLGLLGTISCMSILHVHKRLSRFLLDPLGILITNFLICNLGVVVSQIPFSAVSSIAGRWLFGHIGCKIYAALGMIFGLGSIFSFFLILLDFYMMTDKTKLSRYYFNKSLKNQGLFYIKLISLKWFICIWLTAPPMMEVLGRMGLEPFGTACTIDYWHGNFKNYRIYIAILVSLGFLIPFSSCIYLYFKSLNILRKWHVERTSLKLVELNHITGLAKFCGVQFALILLCWSPFALICTYTLVAGAKDINIFMSMVPPIMAKFYPILSSFNLFMTLSRISSGFQWIKDGSKVSAVPIQIYTSPKQLWFGME